QRDSAVFSKNIVRLMSCDGCQPGRKFFRVPHTPACFPCFDQRVLYDVLCFLTVLQNAVSDGEECPAMCTNDHLKSLSMAVKGPPIFFALTGIHWVDLKPRRSIPRNRAKIFRFFFSSGL